MTANVFEKVEFIIIGGKEKGHKPFVDGWHFCIKKSAKLSTVADSLFHH